MQAAHLDRGVAAHGGELLDRVDREPERATQAAQGCGIVRHDGHAPQLEELHAVFESPQQRVRVAQGAGAAAGRGRQERALAEVAMRSPIVAPLPPVRAARGLPFDAAMDAIGSNARHTTGRDAGPVATRLVDRPARLV